jgi:CheY-like chemotaxis protein
MDKQAVQALVWLVDPLERDLIQLVLQRMGLKTGLINDPVTFLQRTGIEKPLVVILDMVLPGANALDLIRALKADLGSLTPKSIVISSLAFPDVIGQAREIGVDEFVVKPLDSTIFEERLRKLVNIALSAGNSKTLI